MQVVQRRTRGFTLIELMIVVVIVGVLAVLAVTGYRKYAISSRNSEAVQFLQAVRAAQFSYFAANGSFCGSTTESVWPPRIPGVGDGKLPWNDPNAPIPENNAWHTLGVTSPGHVYFQYRMAAGRAGENGGPAIQDDGKPWFWVQANGDFDGNGVLSTFEVTSQSEAVWKNAERVNE